jgi:GcrA cell cycle regulator
MWTKEREELLRTLWADGLSAGRIAEELGGVTRNAIIGKVHRLGLSGRKQGNPQGVNQRKPRTQRPVVNSLITQLKARAAAVAVKPGPVFEIEPELEAIPYDNVIPIGQRCSLMNLTEDRCHWPIGDPRDAHDFFFCGGRAIPGLPYCGYHTRIAYQPAADRRREKRQLPHSAVAS